MSRTPAAVIYTAQGDEIASREEAGGDWALRIFGNVTPAPPETPQAKTEVRIFGDDPLAFGAGQNPKIDSYTIPAGETFTALRLIVGGEGDSTENGSRVDLVYVDSQGADHLIARQYVQGFTVETNLATSAARDGVALTGDGATARIEIRRIRLSGGALEIDALLVGYF